jgi:hypothetical protein
MLVSLLNIAKLITVDKLVTNRGAPAVICTYGDGVFILSVEQVGAAVKAELH